MSEQSEQSVFVSGDLEETEAFLSTAYTPMNIGGRPQDTRARITRRSVGELFVDELEFGYTMSFDAGPLEQVVLAQIADGVHTSNGEAFGPGSTFLMAPPDLRYVGEVRRARYTLTTFPTHLLDRAHRDLLGPDAGSTSRLSGSSPVSVDAHRLLAGATAHVRALTADPVAAGSSLIMAGAVRHLAAVALHTLPTMAEERVRHAPDPLRRDLRDARDATLRRAARFIDDNAHLDIGLAEIAGSVPVTPRAIQYAFARHGDTTPLAYLKRVRLARAHEELKAADPDVTTVTRIAVRWGFAHQGRFAAAYRTAYGASPSHTLHGHRPG
ncbi:AraC family transcriptional regulator [Streptomyces sp. NPDC097619]|uniref:helix-turn-helix transcriptional regulator n=1 Tax=Streptomyces sp. NPDC097619 TaxID=3157228 RepID=UPI0033301FA0